MNVTKTAGVGKILSFHFSRFTPPLKQEPNAYENSLASEEKT
jgi:hypothetical protein